MEPTSFDAAGRILPDIPDLSTPEELQEIFWVAINYSCLVELICLGDLCSYYYEVSTEENDSAPKVALEKSVIEAMFFATGYDSDRDHEQLRTSEPE